MNPTSPDTGDELVFVPLGGAGEIGMNLYLYGLGAEKSRQWLMVDLGVRFGDSRDPGIDVVFPDIAFIEAQKDRLAGIVLTHAHEDHFGAVIDLWPRLRVPVYATPFTTILLKAKIAEYGAAAEIDIREVPCGGRLDIGPFNVEFIAVTHSIPEPNALAIRTPTGNVLHTGDWKIDEAPMLGAPMAVDRLKALGDEGCRALVCDSTNVLRDGVSPSETEIAEGLARVIASATNRVAVTTFASNVGRLRAVVLAAKKADRHVVVAGRAMMRAINAAREAGYLTDIHELLTEHDFGYLPRDKVVCLCTGSQGEGRAALARIAGSSHPNITLNADDMVIFSSKTIPGNEKSVAAVQNRLAAQGIEIVTADDHLVHVTGHPRRGEMKQMYEWVRPKSAVPVHGELRHLHEHVQFAKDQGVTESMAVLNGNVARIAPGPLELIGTVESGELFMDGRVIIASDDGTVRERRKLSYVGTVSVSIIMDQQGALLCDPIIDLYGMPQNDAAGRDLGDVLFDALEAVLKSLPKKKCRDDDFIEDVVSRAIRKEADLSWGKKPVCRVLVSRL